MAAVARDIHDGPLDVAQRDDGIRACRSSGGHEGRHERHGDHEQQHQGPEPRVRRRLRQEQALQEWRRQKAARYSDKDTGYGRHDAWVTDRASGSNCWRG